MGIKVSEVRESGDARFQVELGWQDLDELLTEAKVLSRSKAYPYIKVLLYGIEALDLEE